tara:strand:+ start:17894 stop:18322 length:429 start_codon:yes stop_codon:yes gene_type:complete
MIEYKDDKKVNGVQTFDNGDVYEGSFKDGKKHGKGVLKTRNNRSYEGDWEFDKPHGFGINTFPNGKIYTGNFENGKPVGEGQWTYADGRTYNGIWVKGEFINKQDELATQEYRLITFFINVIVIGGMISFIVYWILSFLKII